MISRHPHVVRRTVEPTAATAKLPGDWMCTDQPEWHVLVTLFRGNRVLLFPLVIPIYFTASATLLAGLLTSNTPPATAQALNYVRQELTVSMKLPRCTRNIYMKYGPSADGFDVGGNHQ